jgi:hypothetical protein
MFLNNVLGGVATWHKLFVRFGFVLLELVGKIPNNKFGENGENWGDP